MSLIKHLLLEFNKAELDLTNRLGKFLSYKKFDIDRDYVESNKHFQGKGAWSLVLSSPKYPKYVLRITDTNVGGDKMEKLVGKDFDNVVKVFYAKSFKVDSELHISVMEKLDEVDEELQRTIFQISDILRGVVGRFTEMSTMIEYYIKGDSFDGMDIIDYAYELAEERQLKSSKWMVRRYFDDVKSGYYQLKTVGITHTDMHIGNIMYDPKTDNYKLIDIS